MGLEEKSVESTHNIDFIREPLAVGPWEVEEERQRKSPLRIRLARSHHHHRCSVMFRYSFPRPAIFPPFRRASRRHKKFPEAFPSPLLFLLPVAHFPSVQGQTEWTEGCFLSRLPSGSRARHVGNNPDGWKRSSSIHSEWRKIAFSLLPFSLVVVVAKCSALFSLVSQLLAGGLLLALAFLKLLHCRLNGSVGLLHNVFYLASKDFQ